MEADRTILLIDDEEPLLRLMELYLDRMGYRVVASLTVEEALNTLTAPKHPIDLLIADLSLLKHRDSLVEIAEQHPALRILVCSGLPFEVDVLPEPLQARFGSLQKPFLPDMLHRAVEELLARHF
jgi:DNA-binding NtrC family response regulator